MSHIIGRPNDDLLDVLLGHGADPEQAFIDGSEQGREVADGIGRPLPRRPRQSAAPGRASLLSAHSSTGCTGSLAQMLAVAGAGDIDWVRIFSSDVTQRSG